MKLALISKLFHVFDARSRIMVFLLICMGLIGAVFEMFGIGVIIPLVTLFSSPNPLEANVVLKKIYGWLEPESQNQFVIWVLTGMIMLYIVKNIYLAALAYLQNRFIRNKKYQLGCRLFQSYLHSSYEFHLKHNSSELLRNIKLVEVVMSSVFMPVILCILALPLVL